MFLVKKLISGTKFTLNQILPKKLINPISFTNSFIVILLMVNCPLGGLNIIKRATILLTIKEI